VKLLNEKTYELDVTNDERQVYVHHSVNSVRVGGRSFATVCPRFSNSLPNDGTFALSLYFSLRSVAAYNTIPTVGPDRLCSLVYVFSFFFVIFSCLWFGAVE